MTEPKYETIKVYVKESGISLRFSLVGVDTDFSFFMADPSAIMATEDEIKKFASSQLGAENLEMIEVIFS